MRTRADPGGDGTGPPPGLLETLLPPGCRVVFLTERLEEAPPLATTLEGWRAAAVPPLAIVCGPEGGWTRGEIDFARSRGWTLASLGERILRAETASIAALALAQALLGDLGR